ncbi:hypothetical protein QFC20_006880 [Naganishia adeliensis]|uniref:Uncharacterized protein n=1 Tax=Naganishia adeliensis TaxID=92952 RepID=A0ACC2V630_9TREE|nr:hypothetical protein QFC20_006880 [Naganishia adeliensis]
MSFDPPCSIFSDSAPVILELGSGQSLASLHLLSELHRLGNCRKNEEEREGKRAEVYLTDLEGVIPLVEENVERWRRKIRQNGSACFDALKQDAPDTTVQREAYVDVHAHPFPWGDTAAADRLLATSGKVNMGITHILMIDLIYFPHLYPLLMSTLLQITQPPFCVIDPGPRESEDGTTGPEVILSYKSRSLEFEEPFFHSFQRYFRMTPLLSRPRREAGKKEDERKDLEAGKDGAEWRVHGREEGVFTYICRRWRDTLPNSTAPEQVAEEDGGLQDGVMRKGGTWGWEEAQLSAIEWD